MISRSAGLVAVSLAGFVLAAPAQGAYPGVNGRVAFTSTQDAGARHIFVTTAAGGIVDLTGARSPATDTQPKFSPNGREIVFTRSAHGLPNSEIFVMSASGAQRTQLTKTPQGNSDPTWSPDGTEIAFVSERRNGVPQIFIMRSDGTNVRRITHDTAAKSELAWSPKGGRIAFVRERAGGGVAQIYSISTDGTGLTDLSRDPANSDVEPAWSPSGKQIVYSGAGHPSGSVGGDLWIMNADGSGQHALEHEDNGYSDGAYPAWSPDGRTIAFTANNGTGYYHVWSVPATGGQNAELVKNAVPGGNPVDQEVDWQPAPSHVALSTTLHAHVSQRQRAATFTFEAPGATGYRCELGQGNSKAGLESCSSPKTYRQLASGTYTFEVIATGPGGPYRAATDKFRMG
jgi:Tol biopolymer transport system component